MGEFSRWQEETSGHVTYTIHVLYALVNLCHMCMHIKNVFLVTDFLSKRDSFILYVYHWSHFLLCFCSTVVICLYITVCCCSVHIQNHFKFMIYHFCFVMFCHFDRNSIPKISFHLHGPGKQE